MLLAKAKRGDQAAFDRLVRRHTPLMYRVAVRITGSGTDAEDVVQDAWISAWRGLSSFRQDAQVSTWLYRVVSNNALMQVRRRRHTVSLEEALPGEQTGVYASESLRAELGIDPEEAAIRSERLVNPPCGTNRYCGNRTASPKDECNYD